MPPRRESPSRGAQKIATAFILPLAAVCGTASAQDLSTRTDSCARLGTFVKIALSQIETNATPLRQTYVYRKFAHNTFLAEQLVRAEGMMRSDMKSPVTVATELQSECESVSTQVAMLNSKRTTHLD